MGSVRRSSNTDRGGGIYHAVAVDSEGLLAVTDHTNKCVHLFSKDGALVRSIGEGFCGPLFGVAFDLKGNIWVADTNRKEIANMSQNGQHLRTICNASGENRLEYPMGVSISPEGMIYICNYGNHHVTVHDEGKFLISFGSKGSGPGCFNEPRDVTVSSHGLVYVTDEGNKRVCVCSKEGTFKRDFKTKYAPTCIAATSDNHLVITSLLSRIVMVYTLEGELVHEFGGKGSDLGRFNGPWGICVDGDGLVYVAEWENKRVQVF